MGFRFIETGKTYAEGGNLPQDKKPILGPTSQDLLNNIPIIWEAGNPNQIRSLLVLREAELIMANAQLTGSDQVDWYIKNRIADLEIEIDDLRRWLTECS